MWPSVKLSWDFIFRITNTWSDVMSIKIIGPDEYHWCLKANGVQTMCPKVNMLNLKWQYLKYFSFVYSLTFSKNILYLLSFLWRFNKHLKPLLIQDFRSINLSVHSFYTNKGQLLLDPRDTVVNKKRKLFLWS